MSSRSRTEWLRTATLAAWVRSTIWGKQNPTPYSLLGWEDPSRLSHPGSRDDAAEELRRRVLDDWVRRTHGEVGH